MNFLTKMSFVVQLENDNSNELVNNLIWTLIWFWYAWDFRSVWYAETKAAAKHYVKSESFRCLEEYFATMNTVPCFYVLWKPNLIKLMESQIKLREVQFAKWVPTVENKSSNGLQLRAWKSRNRSNFILCSVIGRSLKKLFIYSSIMHHNS